MNYAKSLKNLVNRSKEVKATSAYLVCSVFQRCLILITLPIFTRLLTTEEYGISTVYASTLAVAIIFTSLNLPYGSFSPAMMKFKNDRDGYVSAVNTICILFSVVYFAVYLLFKGFWNSLVKLPTELMILMGFEMLFNTTIQFWMGKTRFEYKYKGFVFVTLLMTLLGTISSILAVIYLPNKGIVKVLANGVVVCIIGFVILIQSLAKGKECFNKEYWKYALSFNVPLIPYYLSQVIFNQSDRLMINKMTGKSDAAIYGVAYTLAFVLTFVLNAINDSFVPWMYRRINEKTPQDIKNISLIIATIMAVLLLGIIAFAPEIIYIIGGKKYISAIWVVPPVAMSLLLLFYSQLFINVEFYYEEKYKLVRASILAAIVNVVLNYFGIKIFGFVAAGYTTLISYIIFAVCNFFAMKSMQNKIKNLDDYYDIPKLIMLFILFVIIGLLFTVLYNYRWIRVILICICLCICCFMKRQIKTRVSGFINSIKSK